jgi:hypothetical protein
MSITTSSKKRNFVLKNVNIEEINKLYGLSIISNLEKEKNDSLKTTKINEVISQDIEYSVTFLDENKRENKCKATMIELLTKNIIPDKTHIKCFWCKYSFDTKPIGCPIKYVNPLIEKSYISQITKDKYYMRENIVKSKLKHIIENNNDHQFDITAFPSDYYLTDGVFCSFNCVLAFVKDNNHDVLYKESYSLLHCLYYDLVGKKITKIIQSPHWRLLSDFGGPFSIEEYRKNLNFIDFKFLFNIRDMKSISKIYKETY